MFCPKCGKEVQEGTTFCPNCGNSFAAGGTQAAQPPMQTKVISSGLVPAILVTLFCCLPFGIVSIVYAAKVSSLLQSGDVLLAMGNSDVPVGQYTQKIFAYYGLDEAALNDAGVLTYGTNVKEVTSQVAEAAVDCGIIYATDAFSDGLTVVAEATAEMCGQVIYPAAVLNITKNEEAAKAFLAYLQTDEAAAVFESVGFTPLI